VTTDVTKPPEKLKGLNPDRVVSCSSTTSTNGTRRALGSVNIELPLMHSITTLDILSISSTRARYFGP
jgi:hypothetical protein